MSEEIAVKILEGQSKILNEVVELKQDVSELKTKVGNLEKGQEEIIEEVSSSISSICVHIDKRLGKVERNKEKLFA